MGSRGQRSMFGKKKKRNDAVENGGTAEKSETKAKESASLPAITGKDGKTNEFATTLRNEMYDEILRGEKLDLTNYMENATSRRKKIQSVDINFSSMPDTQRRQFAYFLQNHKKYITFDNGYKIINIAPRNAYPSRRFEDLSELIR